jgi:hypothetical protein
MLRWQYHLPGTSQEEVLNPYLAATVMEGVMKTYPQYRFREITFDFNLIVPDDWIPLALSDTTRAGAEATATRTPSCSRGSSTLLHPDLGAAFDAGQLMANKQAPGSAGGAGGRDRRARGRARGAALSGR